MYNSRNNNANNVVSPVKMTISNTFNNPHTPDTAVKRNSTQANQNNNSLTGEKQTQAELWKSRCNELETSLCQANSDLELANFRARKALELESKIENILKQNQVVCSENEVLQKQANQRKAESDIWRQKYESQMNNIISLKSNYEMEVKRLVQENQRLRDELKQSEIDKIRAVEDTKFRLNTESHEKTENLKKSHQNNLDLYEEQLRKIRQILEDREKEIALLQSQVSQIKYDGNTESTRIAEDREKLKMKISELEVQTQQELENLRSKLDNQAQQQLDSLKKLHDNELEVMAGEINKLRNLLAVKTREIEALIEQNRGLKVNFDEENQLLRAEIQAFKDRIIENNEFANQQIQEIKEQLAAQNAQDIEGLKYHHENQLEALNNEIDNLKRIINDKQQEIENQIKEKQLQRENYAAELNKLLDDLENWKAKYAALEALRNKELEDAANKYNQLNANHNEFARQQNEQIKHQQGEIENLKSLLNSKNDEINKNRDQHGQIVCGLQSDIKNLQEDNEEVKKTLHRVQNERDITVEDLKMKLQIAKNNAVEEKKKLEKAIQYLEQDIVRFKEIICSKEQEVENLKKQRENQDREIKKLNNENASQLDHIQRLERLKVKELDELRNRMENNNNFTIEQMKISHQNQVNIMNGEIEDLKHMCSLKNNEINELVAKYEKLEQALVDFKYNAEKIKEHNAQCNSIGNEILNNKSIYDSYSKARNSRYPSNQNIK